MMKNIIFYQQELTFSKQVILKSKLNWKVHVDAKCQKALVAFYQLRRVTGKTWGYSPKIVHWIYTVVTGYKANVVIFCSGMVATG